MTIKLVSSAAELTAALRMATGGETIVLADGDYGELYLNRSGSKAAVFQSPTSEVTVTALNPGRVTFDSITLKGIANLTFDGVTVDGAPGVTVGSSDITIRNSEIEYLLLRDAENVLVENSTFGGGQFAMAINNSSHVTFRNNYLHGVSTDLMRVVGGSSDVLIENNHFGDLVPGPREHADMIQMFAQEGLTPRDITIRGNLFYDNPETGDGTAQGIFMANASASGYRDILIEQNLIWNQHGNTIFSNYSISNVVVRDNSLIATQYSDGANLRMASGISTGLTVEGNVMRNVQNQTDSRTFADENYFYGSGKFMKAYDDQSDLFQSPDYIGWKSFLPVKGSEIDFGSAYGAQDRLGELLAGVDNDFGIIRLVAERAGSTGYRATSSSYTNLGDSSALHLEAATLTLDFNASTVASNRTIVAKDAVGLGHGFAAMIDDGTLILKFEDDDGLKTITRGGIAAGTDYELTMSFQDGVASAWLDGKMIGQVETGMDWRENNDDLVLGIHNGISSGMKYSFAGTIGDLRIYDHGLDYDQVSGLVSARETLLDAVAAARADPAPAYYSNTIQTFGADLGDTVVSGSNKGLALDEGTVMIDFRANMVNSVRGLVSRDSEGEDHGFSVYFNRSTLYASFEDDDGTQVINLGAVDRYTDYRVVVNFGDGRASAWLNGDLKGTVATDMDWTDSRDPIVLGALNKGSTAGTTDGLSSAYPGALPNVLILDHSMTAAEAADYIDQHPLLLM